MVGNQLPAGCEGSNLAPIPVNELGNIFASSQADSNREYAQWEISTRANF